MISMSHPPGFITRILAPTYAVLVVERTMYRLEHFILSSRLGIRSSNDLYPDDPQMEGMICAHHVAIEGQIPSLFTSEVHHL